MARTTWQIEKRDSNNIFQSDGTIYAPNDDLSINITSTTQVLNLANGGQAFVTPETKHIREPIVFIWLEIPESDSFRSKIENYIKNSDYLRITTDLSETLTGRFTRVERAWILGTEDTYDLQASFSRIE